MKTSDKGKGRLPQRVTVNPSNLVAKHLHKSCVSKVEESKKQKIYESVVDSEAESQYYDGCEMGDINCSGIEIGDDENERN